MYNPTSYSILFILSQRGETLERVAAQRVNEEIKVNLPGAPLISCGIYTEIIPGEAGSDQPWQEIEVAKINGKLVSTNKDTYVFDEPEWLVIHEDDPPEVKIRKFSTNRALKHEAIVCRVTILHAPLERREHPDGKTCVQCRLWSRKRGIEELNNITHMYSNGSFAMTKEIINTVCDIQKAPSLTDVEVGYCSANQELCADTSPACEHFDDKEVPK